MALEVSFELEHLPSIVDANAVISGIEQAILGSSFTEVGIAFYPLVKGVREEKHAALTAEYVYDLHLSGFGPLGVWLSILDHSDPISFSVTVTACNRDDLGTALVPIVALAVLTDDTSIIEDPWGVWVTPRGTLPRREFYRAISDGTDYSGDLRNRAGQFLKSLPRRRDTSNHP